MMISRRIAVLLHSKTSSISNVVVVAKAAAGVAAPIPGLESLARNNSSSNNNSSNSKRNLSSSYYSQPKQSNNHNHLVRTVWQRSFSTQAVQDTNTISIHPWKTHMVESNGDYRDEAFLEKEIGGNLYQHQANLPKLPVPDLADTMERFLPMALPLAKTADEAAALQQACDGFCAQAEPLQQRLIDRQENEMKDSSWLQLYWNQLGYLQVRDSVVVNVSYFFQFQNDPSIPVVEASNTTPANVQRAATLLYATAEFRKEACSGDLEPELLGKAKIPLDATAYKYMFHACRIPRKVQDSYRMYDPSRYSHAVVARKGMFFAIDIADKESGNPLPLVVIEAQLQQCIDMADNTPPSSSRPKIGILTSTNRDNWAEHREKLLALGGTSMEKALEVLESGALLVNLDDTNYTDDVQCSEMLLTGRQESGDNRWFDKSIQIVVDENGTAGTLSEHSMMDGMPVTRFADYITGRTYEEVKKESSSSGQNDSHNVIDIFGDTLSQIDQTEVDGMVAEAREEFHENIGKQATSVVTYDGYGSSFIKKSGNPPDAFVQVAMQLATARLFGEQVGTYEATQVRRFLHGRTEVTRAVTLESAAFVNHMIDTMDQNDDVDAQKEKFELLKNATAAHAGYSQLAAQAMGVDRHFFGLSMMVDADEEAPTIYSDPVFNRSKYWRLSTSNLSHPRIVNWGFGQVVPDGVGVGYSIHPNSLKFNISALESTGWAPELGTLLEESLEEMHVVAAVGSGQEPMSKL